MSGSEVQTEIFSQLAANLTEGQNGIRDYHFMVEQFDRIGTESYDFENGSDPEVKWTKISDVFHGFGYPFTANQCKDLFYKWSAFYAQNYEILNGKIEPKCQQNFDLLKVVHILDFTRIWSHSNLTHSLLRRIAKKREIKAYLIAYKKRQDSEIETNIEYINGTVVNSINVSLDEPVSSFENMRLKPELLRGILELGYQIPSYIQQRAIIPAIVGRNVIAQAQSGTGKTAAFAIPILQRIDTSLNECQALILVPTHELVQQIRKEITQLSKYNMKIKCHTSIGGFVTKKDLKGLKKKPHIVIGTPNRIIDMMDKEEDALQMDCFKILVLDEFDKLLDLNGQFITNQPHKRFENQFFEIYRTLKPDIQLFLTSATIPKDILDLLYRLEETKLFMRNAFRIQIKDEELTLRGVQQYYVIVEEGFKFKTFFDLYKTMTASKSFESSKAQAFVYLNRRDSVEELVFQFKNVGITVDYTHGKMNEQHRQRILNKFRQGKIRVLITTDMLGRGIDVKEVEYVFNYDLNVVRETYMHRVGRSGRFGRSGKAITLVTQAQMTSNPLLIKTRLEELTLPEIAEFYNTEVNPLPQDLSDIF